MKFDLFSYFLINMILNWIYIIKRTEIEVRNSTIVGRTSFPYANNLSTVTSFKNISKPTFSAVCSPVACWTVTSEPKLSGSISYTACTITTLECLEKRARCVEKKKKRK